MKRTAKVSATACALATTVVISMRLAACSTAPSPSPTPTPPAPTPAPETCTGSDVRETACPAGNGTKVEVCVNGTYKVAVDPCDQGGNGGGSGGGTGTGTGGTGTGGGTGGSGGSGGACSKLTFVDVSPIFEADCKKCHAALTTFATAKSWASGIARRVGLPVTDNDHMPELGSQQLDAGQIAKLQRWVSDGANDQCPDTGSGNGQAQAPALITEDYLLSAANKDAASINATDREDYRYISVAEAYNQGIRGDALKAYVDGLNKALNSISVSSQDLEKAVPVDPQGVLFRIDLGDYGIDDAGIKAIEKADLFNIVDNSSQGQVLQGLLKTAKPLWDASAWIDTTLRNPKIYYQLTKVPPKLADYQKQVGVDFNGNLAKLQQINFIGNIGQITEQKNRLIVRTVQSRSEQAYFWQTFDVNDQPNNAIVNNKVVDLKNLLQNPLLKNTGAQAAPAHRASVANFTADASETIVQLPNGMQGYGLWDAKGNRLDAADPGIVIDTETPLGNKVISVGITCSRCHNNGLIPMADEVLASVTRNAGQFLANDVRLVQAVYGDGTTNTNNATQNAALFSRDQAVHNNFLTKLGVSLGADPINVVNDSTQLNWTAEHAAAFLKLSVDDFKQCVQTSPNSQQTMGQFLTGGSVPFSTFIANLKQLILDCNLFQDPIAPTH